MARIEYRNEAERKELAVMGYFPHEMVKVEEKPRYDIAPLAPTMFQKDGRIVYQDKATYWVLNDGETASPLKWNGNWTPAHNETVHDAEVGELKVKITDFGTPEVSQEASPTKSAKAEMDKTFKAWQAAKDAFHEDGISYEEILNRKKAKDEAFAAYKKAKDFFRSL